MKTAILTTLLAIAPLSMTAVAQQPEYDNSGAPRRVIVYPELLVSAKLFGELARKKG